MALRYAELVYYGQWYHPLREAMDAFFSRTSEPLTGTARIKLYKGNCRTVGVQSPKSMYMADLASFTIGEEYDSTDAVGFVKLFGLPMKVNGIVERDTGGKPSAKRKSVK